MEGSSSSSRLVSVLPVVCLLLGELPHRVDSGLAGGKVQCGVGEILMAMVDVGLLLGLGIVRSQPC